MNIHKGLVLFLGLSLAAFVQVGAQDLKISVVKNLPADPDPQEDKFTLFSLSSGKQVPLEKFESDEWDLGFKGTSIIVNGGTERSGKGGAFLTTGVFEAVESVPDKIDWQKDGPDGKTAIPGGSGNGWYQYVFTTHEIKPLPNKVLFVKTADGKYAKVEVLSYYRDVEGETDSPGRYYTFRYVYQPDGSGKLK
jgi:hypothetical protein